MCAITSTTHYPAVDPVEAQFVKAVNEGFKAVFETSVVDVFRKHMSSKKPSHKNFSLKKILLNLGLQKRITDLRVEILNLKKLHLTSPESLDISEGLRKKQQELSKLKKEHKPSKEKNYSYDDAQFVKEGLRILKEDGQGIQSLLDDMPANELYIHRMMHFALRGSLHADVASIDKTYNEGMIKGLPDIFRFTSITGMLYRTINHPSSQGVDLRTKKEKTEFLRLCQHRLNVSAYRLLYNDLYDSEPAERKEKLIQLIHTIQSNIDELEQPTSLRTIELDDQTKSFTIPGVAEGHATCYEIQRDRNGSYYFILHNKGDGVADEYLHGKCFRVGDKKYVKASVKIQVDKSVLRDPKFLSFLIQDDRDDSQKEINRVLYQFLIVEGNGQFVLSEQEKLINILSVLLEDPYLIITPPMHQKILSLTEQLRMMDPNNHSVQLHSTCGASNAAIVDKGIAGQSVLRKEKYWQISNLADEVFANCFLNAYEIPKIEAQASLAVSLDAITQLEDQLPATHLLFKKINLSNETFLGKIKSCLEFAQNANRKVQASHTKLTELRGITEVRQSPKGSAKIKSLQQKIKNLVRKRNDKLKCLKEVLGTYKQLVGDTRILYLHTLEKIEKLQHKIKTPPKKPQPPQAMIDSIFEEAVSNLIAIELDETRIEDCMDDTIHDTTSSAEDRLLSLYQEELSSLFDQYKRCRFQYFNYPPLFSLMLLKCYEIVRRTRGLFDTSRSHVHPLNQKKIEKLFLQLERSLDKDRVLQALMEGKIEAGLKIATDSSVKQGQIDLFKQMLTYSGLSAVQQQQILAAIPSSIKIEVFQRVIDYFSGLKDRVKVELFTGLQNQ